MKQEKYDIFISYRRSNGADAAKHLRDILVGKGYRVFFDTDSLRSGDFNYALLDVIRNCTDFIIILSPNALDRCVNEHDWVRLELACALQSGKNVIPVLHPDFSFPDSLPEDIDGVRMKNGIISNIDYFDAMIKKLLSFLHSRPRRRSVLCWLLPVAALMCAALVFAVLILPNLNRQKDPEPPEITRQPAVQTQAPSSAAPAEASATARPHEAFPTETLSGAQPTAQESGSEWNGGNVLMSDGDDLENYYSDAPVFGSEYSRSQIRSVSVLDTLAGMPQDAWDVSRNGDGSVMAWAVPNEELYDLYIAGEGGVSAPKNCTGLFSGYFHALYFSFGSAFHTDAVTNMKHMFSNLYSLKQLDLRCFSTSNVTAMNYMFEGCNQLESLDLSSFDTSCVENMSWMFLADSSLEELDLSSFSTSKVRYMSRMFNGCRSLKELDLSGFDTSHAVFMDSMFQGCSKLKTLILGRFDTSSLEKTDQLFTGCEALSGIYFDGDQAEWLTSALEEASLSGVQIIRGE